MFPLSIILLIMSKISQHSPLEDDNFVASESPLSFVTAPLAELPTREQAEEAIRTLIAYVGDNPNREGLLATPARVVDSFSHFYGGYQENLADILATTFDELSVYDDVVLVKSIAFQSHCEHHMVPILGHAHVAYLPHLKVVGLSKLARVVDALARRLQTQEMLTKQIADALETYLQPHGVAVIIEADHQCMSTRGVCKQDSQTVTTQMRGEFKTSSERRRELFELIRN